MTFFPNRENVYPIVAAATSGCVEASTICGRLKEGPDEGSFMTSEIIVAVAAIPIATATFARSEEAPGVVDSTSTVSITSFRSSPSEEGPAPVADAFAVRGTKQDKLHKLFLFTRIQSYLM